MNTTVEDYQKALDGWLEDVRGMGGDVVSVLLCGSMARGDVLPGKSDIMDAYLFLRDEVFDDRERFIRALEQMVTSCERLSQSGLPFHPFYYWPESGRLPAATLESLKAERESKILSGEDLRPGLAGDAASYYGARCAFFEARRKGYRLMALCRRQELTEQERRLIVNALTQFKKYVPVMACRTLNLWPTQQTAQAVLKERWPDIDASVMDRIETLRARPESEISDAELREVLGEAVEHFERLNDAILAELAGRGEG